MNRLHWLALASAALLAWLLWQAVPQPSRPAAGPARPAPESLLIRGARVFDGERTWPRADVLVQGGQIAAIAESLAVPAGADVIDAAGQTLLPGLIDAHVHTWGEARRQMLRFGVTSALDMFSSPDTLQAQRAERAALAPSDRADLWSAGAMLTAKGGHGTQFGLPLDTLDDPADAVRMVDARVDAGSDYIKFVLDSGRAYRLPRALPTLDGARIDALVAAAHARGVMAVAHVADTEAVRQVLAAGADGLVHVWSDEVAEPALVQDLAQRKVFVIPTFSVMASLSGDGRSRELAQAPEFAASLDAGQRASLQQEFPALWRNPAHLVHARETVRRLHAAGVDILAGTDAGNPGTAHGASLHGELEFLTEAGLTPEQALRAATSLPARRFGIGDRGRIAAGLRADLLLVDGDPTRDIRTTRRIVRVWKNGAPVDRDAPAAQAPGGRFESIRSDFDNPQHLLAASHGVDWQATTDQMTGGASQVRLETAGGAAGSRGALALRGTIAPGAPYPWAGAMLFMTDPPMSPVQAPAGRTLRFQARGDGRRYNVLLFSGAQAGGVPVGRSFTSTADWQAHAFALADFSGADLDQLRAIAITASAPDGEFEVLIDEVSLQ